MISPHIRYFLILQFSVLSCVENTPRLIEEPIEKQVFLKEESIIPKKFNQPKLKDIVYNISAKFLDLGKVNRYRAEFRDGPGVQFKLRDGLLVKNTVVLKVDSYGNWLKIIDPQTSKIGWIHRKAISKHKVGKKSYFQLDSISFPRIYLVKNVKKIYDYRTKQQIRVNIPKGTPFTCLKKQKNHYLVLLKHTNSLAWLSRKDAQ